MARNQIVLRSPYGSRDEGALDTTCSPGMAVRRAVDGDYDMDPQTQAQALTSGLEIALEDALQGKTATQALAVGDIVQTIRPLPGDIVMLLVKSGEDIDLREPLCTEGGGTGLFVAGILGTIAKVQFESLEDTGGALGADTLVEAICVNP